MPVALRIFALSFFFLAGRGALHFSGYDWHGVCQYVLLPGGLGLFFLALSWLPRRAQSARLACLGGFVLAAYGLEAHFLIRRYQREKKAQAFPAVAFAESARREGAPFDTRSPREVFSQMKRENGRSAVILPPSLFWSGRETAPHLPLGGISRVPTLYCNEGGRYIAFESDEHGFRNPPGLYQGPALDILIVGDSFAQGACVSDTEHAAARIRALTPRTLTLGYADNGPLTEYASFLEFAPGLRPRQTWVFYYEGNDLQALRAEAQSARLAPYLQNQVQGLGFLQNEVDGYLRAVLDRRWAQPEERLDWGTLWRRFPFLDSLKAELPWATVDRRHQPWDFSRKEIPLMVELWSRARDRTAVWGGEVRFVYLPEWRRFGKTGYADTDHQAILESLAHAGIRVVDLTPHFAAVADPLRLFPFRLAGHYTPEGHRLVADVLTADFQSSKREGDRSARNQKPARKIPVPLPERAGSSQLFGTRVALPRT